MFKTHLKQIKRIETLSIHEQTDWFWNELLDYTEWRRSEIRIARLHFAKGINRKSRGMHPRTRLSLNSWRDALRMVGRRLDSDNDLGWREDLW